MDKKNRFAPVFFVVVPLRIRVTVATGLLRFSFSLGFLQFESHFVHPKNDFNTAQNKAFILMT